MTLTPPPTIDTRSYFRPVSTALVDVLRALPEDAWTRATVAGSWTVRDVLAHLVDVTWRRVSFHRDRMVPPPPDIAITSERDFVRFINSINAEWVKAARRFSPRVLTDMFAKGSSDLADWFESLPLDAPALFGVSWAGEQESQGWFDIAREFTELWHHQEQIRMATATASLTDPRYLHAVIDTAVRGLPHAFRDVKGVTGDTLVLNVTGAAGGMWTLSREAERWALFAGEVSSPTTRVSLSDDNAWKLLFNALPAASATTAVAATGDERLVGPLLKARSIVI